jgi:hypothetical protein
MSHQLIEASEELKQMVPTIEHPKQAEPVIGPREISHSLDPAMARICIELLTRATLYAGAFGLILGLAAALLLPE